MAVRSALKPDEKTKKPDTPAQSDGQQQPTAGPVHPVVDAPAPAQQAPLFVPNEWATGIASMGTI
jgi:hypothetical protein